MNKKAIMLDDFFNDNQFPVGVYETPNDKLHTVTFVANARKGRKYLMNVDDTDLIKVICPLFDGVLIDNYPTLYKVCHDLSRKYFSHSYTVDKKGVLNVQFAFLTTDETFSPGTFIGYCSMIDDYVEEDNKLLLKYFEDLRDAYAKRAAEREKEEKDKKN